MTLSPLVEIYVNAAWTDVSSSVRVADGVAIRRGRQDEQSALSPSTCTMTFNNAAGQFSPRNPTGPYYGTIGRNTPVRVSVAGSYRFHGEISAWPPRWDLSEADAWVTVQASGITRRLTQGPKPLQGPIPRYVSGSTGAVAYWPCEDAAGSTSIASAISFVAPMAVEGTTLPLLAAASPFSTSEALPVMNNGSFRGVPAHGGGDAWTYFLLSVPTGGDTNDSVLLRLLGSGTAFRWEVRYFTASSGNLVLRCFDNAGASLLTSAAVGFGLDNTPCIVALKLDQNGANIDYALTVYNFANGASSAVSGTIAANTIGALNQVQISADRVTVGSTVGHILMTNTDQTTAVVNAMRGYAGETAGRRLERLCAEETVAFTSVGSLDDTEAMGSQTSSTLIELIAECEAADDGYLYEPKTALAIAYRTRKSMYSQDADATIPYLSLNGLEPVEDDQGTRNDVTVSRIDGSSVRVEVTAGALSTAAPPNGVGRYNVSVPLSLAADTQLQAQAEWRAALGTVDEPRYPALSCDLQTLAPLVKTATITLDVGDQISITGTPIWVPAGGISAVLLGYTETIEPHAWTVNFNCGPGAIWSSVMVLDSTTRGRLDASTAVTNEPLDATETGVDYTAETITTTGAEYPLGLLIGGEEMTASAATGVTITVARSANGVVKSHATSAPIRLARPARLGL